MRVPSQTMKYIYNDLAANRREAYQAQMKWGVYSRTKKGPMAKTPSWTCKTEEEAHEKAAYLSSINGGKPFFVFPL